MADATFTAGTALDGPSEKTAAIPAAPPADSSFDRVVRGAVDELRTDRVKTDKLLEANRARREGLMERLEASDKERPTMPEIEKPVPPPQQQTPMGAFQAFGSSASVLALFGSLASRRPLTTALNASTAAMNALRQNDEETFERKYKEWKAHSEYAGQVAQWQLERYKGTIDGWKGTQAGLLGQLNAIAALDSDTLAQHAGRTGDIQVVEKFLNDRQAQVERYRDHQLKLDEFVERRQHNRAGERAQADELAERREHDKAMADTPERNAYEAERKLHPEENPVDIVRRLKSRDTNPRSAPAMYLKSWMEEHPGATAGEISRAMADYRAESAAVAGFGPTGAAGKNVVALVTAVNHIDSWEALATKAATGDVHALNSLWNSLRTEIGGDPTGTNAGIAAQFVGPEIVKAVVATGGGVEERDQLKKLLSTRLSKEQVHGSADTAREFLAGRMGPLKQQYQTSVGADDFEERFLSPRAREVFAGIAEKTSENAVAREAEQAFGGYEPDKYEYRNDPQTNKLQRRTK